jgi:hypothetical protein
VVARLFRVFILWHIGLDVGNAECFGMRCDVRVVGIDVVGRLSRFRVASLCVGNNCIVHFVYCMVAPFESAAHGTSWFLVHLVCCVLHVSEACSCFWSGCVFVVRSGYICAA